MSRHYTTTATLPKEMQERYEITEPLEGGPVFDLPHYGQTGVDFSQLTVEMAEALIANDCPYIRRKPQPNAYIETPAETSEPNSDSPLQSRKTPFPPRRQKPEEEGGE